MTERDERRRARRLDDVVNRLQKGKRPRIGPEDAPDAAAIRAASRLAGAREPYPRMDPEFRRRLALRIEGQKQRPSRRWALAAAAGVVGGAALGAAGGRLIEQPVAAPAPAKSWRQEAIVPERSGATWVDTGFALTQLEEGKPQQVTAGGMPVFLVREGNWVRAVSSVCTHKPCQLYWDAESARIACPWGKYQTFSTRGDSLSGELHPLPLAQVRVQEGRVQIYGVS